jgi:hypothetical protein
MIVFPLLERYLKQRAQCEPNRPPFNRELLQILPELTTIRNANLFWSMYRHGILHNVAISRNTHWLSHDKPIVEVQSDKQVWLNPNLLAERVLNVIRSDFSMFENGIPLPQVFPIFEQQKLGMGSYNSYLGTGTPPGTSGK